MQQIEKCWFVSDVQKLTLIADQIDYSLLQSIFSRRVVKMCIMHKILIYWAEIHQALLSQFSLLAEFFIVKVTVKD
jgi:hypothetical protein